MIRTYTVVCLTGDGVGPELIAESSRMLHGVSRLHGFDIEDVHVPFGAEALTRAGHSLPLPTREACFQADAVLVAGDREPDLDGVESELDLRAAVTRVLFAGGGFTLFSPLADDFAEWTAERAFESARSSRARLASVDWSEDWRQLVDRVAAGYDGVSLEHLTVAEGLPALAFEPHRFDVVTTGPVFAPALDEIAATLDREARVVARGRLAGNGPGVFAPAHGEPAEVAGHGVADPSSMVLAASLLLAEGLGERAAAGTLARALRAAQANGQRRRSSARRDVRTTTREFADAVLGLLPAAARSAEFLREVVH